MFEFMPQPPAEAVRNSCIGVGLAINAALGVEAHQNNVAIEDPLIDARAATQQIIENPDPYIARMRGDFEIMYDEQAEDTIDRQAERLDTVILSDLFLQELSDVVGAPDGMPFEDVNELRQLKKPELFAKLQELTQSYYGIEIGFKQQTEVFNGPANSTPGDYPLITPASLEDVEVATIFNLASAIPQVPKSYLTAIGLQRILLFNGVSDREGNGVGGYPDGHGTINLAVNALSEYFYHEVGHELNRRIHGRWYAEDAAFDTLAKPQPVGEGIHPITNNDVYTHVYKEQLEAAEDERILNSASDSERLTTYEDASCDVASRHLADAHAITGMEIGDPNTEEHKARLFSAIFDNDLGEMLDPCKPRLYALTSELLAQLYVIDPDATQWLIASNLSRTQVGPTEPGSSAPVPDFIRALRGTY